MTELDTTQVVRRDVPETRKPLHANALLHRVLAARGVQDSQELKFALSDLPRPDTLPDIDKATKRLVRAHKNHERVLIVGDYDCDGATSTALMMRALNQMGFDQLGYVIPDRAKHGYGLSPAVIDLGIEQHQPSVIITVDNGVSAFEAIDYASKKHIDVVVTDHHLPADKLPHALAIVNPSRADSVFPSANIAGVGVAFYVLVALRKALHEAGCLARNVAMADWLDLVAIGTVADVVPLDKVNRTLVEQGLRRIRAGSAVPGVLALLEAAGRDAMNLASIDIGMVIGPRLNAAGRIDEMRVGVQCLLADTPTDARLHANTLHALNDTRRNIQADMQEEAEAIVAACKDDASQNPNQSDEPRYAYAVHGANWHQGVIGIVAGRLKEQLHLPVVVFANDEHGTDGTDGTDGAGGGNQANEPLLKGSARSIPGVNIRDVFYRVDLLLPGAIVKFGGHAMAAGLTLKAKAFDAFVGALNKEVARALSNELPVRKFETDGELLVADFTLNNAKLLSRLAPWGTRFEAPTFDNYFVVESSRLVGNARHAQYQLRPMEFQNKEHHKEQNKGQADVVGSPLSAISFFDDQTFNSGEEIHAVYELSVNRFKGRESVQMILRHIAAR